MKVFHVSEVNKGGVITVINELVNSQVEDNTIDEVICLLPANDYEMEQDHASNNKKVVLFHYRKSGRNINSFVELGKEFIRVLKEFKPDVVHLHSSFAGLVCRVIMSIYPYRCKIVYCPHAFSFLMQTNKIKKNVYILIERLLQVMTDKIVCVSQYEKQQAVLYGMTESKLEVIYNGVSDKNPNKEFHVRKDGVLEVLFVGRFDYQKGFDILIKAIEKIREKNSNVLFRIIGDFIGEKSNGELPQIDGVEFLGWKSNDEIGEFYKSSDILIMPSRWEGFAMVPIEAFMYGVPVIASKNTSFPEIIDDNINGFLFDTENYISLAEIILSLQSKDITALKNNARIKFEKNYNASIMAKKTRFIYI
ncbi:glycosyltransferase [Klebsiella michiganensis]|uniref:glycosyltransferase n=1 Tax=Klebsiella michiganensis TaxID=1134687 RepID=UPI001BA7FA34|nr:glycosyltransferase [Klebsiella michiganensis]MBS0929049.1 glycosyltransferase [Klebsiella michiganensis]